MSAEILATGRSRAGMVLDHAVGFAASIGLISLGLGADLAIAMAVGGQPDTGGAFMTGLVAGLCAYTGYGLGVLVSQLTRSTPSTSPGRWCPATVCTCPPAC